MNREVNFRDFVAGMACTFSGLFGAKERWIECLMCAALMLIFTMTRRDRRNGL